MVVCMHARMCVRCVSDLYLEIYCLIAMFSVMATITLEIITLYYSSPIHNIIGSYTKRKLF